MAMIDSGLGWSCDSDYYVSAADTVLINETAATVTKTNTGGCIAVSYVTIYNNYGLALVSTEPNCVAATLTGDASSYPDSAVLDGVTWYINRFDSATYRNSRTYVDGYPLSPVQAGIGTTSQEIAGIIQAANVEFDKIIPSTDYVKAFVEGVEAETATRVNAVTTAEAKTRAAVNKVKTVDSVKCSVKPIYAAFEPCSFNGLTNFNGQNVWTDGENIYYSSSTSQYVYDKSSFTWLVKTWNGLTNFIGESVWTDGENIYYSYNGSNYVLNKTTSTWIAKTWHGLTDFNGARVWTDGDDIYFSFDENNYVLDKTTSTWENKAWYGLTNYNGYYVWTDGENIYWSRDTGTEHFQYVLDKSTSTWNVKRWNGLSSFNADQIWTDGENIYLSGSNLQYVLDKTTSTWTAKTWNVTGLYGYNIWSDGNNVYYSSGSTHYILRKSAIKGYAKDIKPGLYTANAKISDIYAILGTYGSDVYGLQVDYENYTYTRLAGAAGKSRPFFDTVAPWKDMRRCNLADDGTVNAYYGDLDYVEDGSNGQVMVEIPKFYYKMVPLKIDPIGDSVGGYHTRKANYYISATKYEGFKTHPAFVRPDGTERDKAYVSAYEGCIYDVSESAYLLADEQVTDFTATTGDKLSSIAGAKPCSGKTQNLTRANSEIIATNRGTGWHSLEIKAVSALQWLFMIEYGTLNSQNAIGKGVVDKTDDDSAVITGDTLSLGNASGMASGTNGLVSVSYRGVENFWGNIWKFIEGLNIWGDGTLRGGQPYICDSYAFTEDTKTGYTGAKFIVSNARNYVSAFGYDPDFDWLFLPSECVGADSDYPIGDYSYLVSNLNGYRVSMLGAHWYDGVRDGAFCWYLYSGAEFRFLSVGARLSYLP